jgi:membrane-bound inhibitor of C-type lysozyme
MSLDSRTTRGFRYVCTSAAALLLAGCFDMPNLLPNTDNIWLIGEKRPQKVTGPAGATEYRCADNKRFYARIYESGAAAWVYFPDREVRMEKTADASATHYSNGIATFAIDGETASLKDGAAVYRECKVAAPVVEK